MNAELLKERIKEILKGIDECEVYSGHGWWETSVGQKFGADKLKEILAAVDEHFQPKEEQSNQLKPCPFCGSVHLTRELHQGQMLVICDDCETCGPSIPGFSGDDAWQTRSAPAEEGGKS